MVKEAPAQKPLGLLAYRALSSLAGAMGWPWLYWRLKSRGFGESFRPRLGLDLPALDEASGHPRLWLHGVSVGEIAGAEPLVRELAAHLPPGSLFLSTGTETGQAVAKRLYAPAQTVFYYPVDLPWTVRRLLDHIQPALYVALETEIWPNFLQAARDRGVKLALMNGRLSEKSLRGYLRFGSSINYIINLFDIIGAGSQEDARGFVALGAAPARVVVTGNTKFERRPNPAAQALAEGFRERLGQGGPVFLAASTHPGEENLIIQAYKELCGPCPALRLWLAPRHPERAAEVGQLLTRAGLAWQSWQKFKAGEEEHREPVVLIDTVGDLFALYSLADLIFVGGSLIPHGGQNILEPAAWGKVPLYGPHLNNFRAARQLLEEAEAGLQVTDAHSLALAGRYCLDHSQEMERRGRRGREALQTHQGAAKRQAELLINLISYTGQAISPINYSHKNGSQA